MELIPPGMGIIKSTSLDRFFFIESQKQYIFPFSVKVPEGSELPSCSESENNVGGIVEYIVEAQIEKPKPDFSVPLKANLRVPILQNLDTSAAGFQDPQTAECHLSQGHKNSILKVTLPKKTYTRNQALPITIDLVHAKPYKAADAFNVSLVRSVRVVSGGISYVLPESIVHYIKADVDISADNGFTQTIKRLLLIPSTISPTIGIKFSPLQISYKVRVVAVLQDISNAGTDLPPMDIEIPIEIGTLPLARNHVPPDVLRPQFVPVHENISLDKESKTRIVAENGTLRANMKKLIAAATIYGNMNIGNTKTGQPSTSPQSDHSNKSSSSNGGGSGSKVPLSPATTLNTPTCTAFPFAFPPPPDNAPPKVDDLIGPLNLDMDRTSFMDAIQESWRDGTEKNSFDITKKSMPNPEATSDAIVGKLPPAKVKNVASDALLASTCLPIQEQTLPVPAIVDVDEKKQIDDMTFTFNIFPDSDLSDEEVDSGKANIKANNLGKSTTGTLTVPMSIKSAPGTSNIYIPHEISESESEHSDEEELLDILSRRDKRLARHTNSLK
ncbi:hypothetical protein BX666DRAFT_2122963 [Dichotomocladium elegans]|nr:hypothetical protein BX666DRAFT_2122963 [Dichotomocladium elegans]